MTIGAPEPQRGDVESVDYADAPPARGRAKHRTPKPDERVAIRLHGHPYTYVVRVAVARGSEPKIAELTIIADDGNNDAVDYEALRSVPARRLAYSARQWIARAGNAFASPDDYRETFTQPENADPKLTELHWRIEQAVMNGLPVRATVAAQMKVSKRTLDRMIAKARAEGLMEGVEIPRRPSPRQRDALAARAEAELYLSEHGLDAELPADVAERLHPKPARTDDQEADR